MITPPMSPRRARLSSEDDGVVPVIETTSFWPTSCASVGASLPVAGATTSSSVMQSAAATLAGVESLTAGYPYEP